MSRIYTWQQVRGSRSPMHELEAATAGHEGDYDMDGAYSTFILAIRDALPEGAFLRGDVIGYDGTWAVEDAAFEINEAIDSVDLTSILTAHELERLPSARWAAVVVPRGAQLISVHAGPVDWRARVNVDALIMSTNSMCVLGQLWLGGFREGIRALGVDGTDGWRYGFDRRPDDALSAEDYNAIKAEWIKVLRP